MESDFMGKSKVEQRRKDRDAILDKRSKRNRSKQRTEAMKLRWAERDAKDVAQ